MRGTMGPVLAVALVGLAACGSKGGAGLQEDPHAQAASLSGGEAVDDKGRCDADGPDREVSEYDTNGDGIPDVRKVFRQVGTPPDTSLVLICREADLNGDGVKDVVRYYDDEGSPVREEADRNFNGQMDLITYYDGGQVVRQEVDRSGDGRVDTKIFYTDGRPVRAERDQSGRSADGRWTPDTWEYYEEGRLVRKGRDLTGDGQVDRWDRNRALREAIDARRRAGAGDDLDAFGEELGAGEDEVDDASAAGEDPVEAGEAEAPAD